MIATEHTQSLHDFTQNANATIERVAQSGEVEILTVAGAYMALNHQGIWHQ